MPQQAPKRKPGRPSKYSDAIATRICEELPYIDGGIEKLCEQPGFPSPSMVFRWLQANPKFREQYTRARELQAEVQAGRIVADAVSTNDAQLGRLRMDARKWMASKLAPKKYGDRVEVETTGEQTIKIIVGGDA